MFCCYCCSCCQSLCLAFFCASREARLSYSSKDVNLGKRACSAVDTVIAAGCAAETASSAKAATDAAAAAAVATDAAKCCSC